MDSKRLPLLSQILLHINLEHWICVIPLVCKEWYNEMNFVWKYVDSFEFVETIDHKSREDVTVEHRFTVGISNGGKSMEFVKSFTNNNGDTGILYFLNHLTKSAKSISLKTIGSGMGLQLSAECFETFNKFSNLKKLYLELLCFDTAEGEALPGIFDNMKKLEEVDLQYFQAKEEATDSSQYTFLFNLFNCPKLRILKLRFWRQPDMIVLHEAENLPSLDSLEEFHFSCNKPCDVPFFQNMLMLLNRCKNKLHTISIHHLIEFSGTMKGSLCQRLFSDLSSKPIKCLNINIYRVFIPTPIEGYEDMLSSLPKFVQLQELGMNLSGFDLAKSQTPLFIRKMPVDLSSLTFHYLQFIGDEFFGHFPRGMPKLQIFDISQSYYKIPSLVEFVANCPQLTVLKMLQSDEDHKNQNIYIKTFITQLYQKLRHCHQIFDNSTVVFSKLKIYVLWHPTLAIMRDTSKIEFGNVPGLDIEYKEQRETVVIIDKRLL